MFFFFFVHRKQLPHLIEWFVESTILTSRKWSFSLHLVNVSGSIGFFEKANLYLHLPWIGPSFFEFRFYYNNFHLDQVYLPCHRINFYLKKSQKCVNWSFKRAECVLFFHFISYCVRFGKSLCPHCFKTKFILLFVI